MNKKYLPTSEKLQPIPTGWLVIGAFVLWLLFAVYIYLTSIHINQLSFLLFSPVSSYLIVWGMTYLVHLILGYGITNTPTYPGARTLNNMELLKPEFAKTFERFLLFITSIVLLSIAAILLTITFYS